MNNDKLPDWNEEPIYKSEPNKEKPDLTTFQQLVDDLVEYSKTDDELADGINWLDQQAQKQGVSFYDKVYEILFQYDVTQNAKRWLDGKSRGD